MPQSDQPWTRTICFGEAYNWETDTPAGLRFRGRMENQPGRADIPRK